MTARRIAGLGAVAALLALAGPHPASASTFSSPEAVARDCAQRHAADAPGVAHRSFTADEAGFLTVTLEGGPAGDWDLALLREGAQRAASASTAFGSDERAGAWVSAGDRVTIQACRRAGTASVSSGHSFFALADLPPVADERVSLESVAISGFDDVAGLEELGFDVTHDVSATAATVVAHSDAERAALATAGFQVTTLIPDLAAADAADREAERADARAAKRGGKALPSGRTTYRQYSDYTTDMKDLADNHPDIAREVTIGTTLEDRPIQGLEIAGDVNAVGDGRPVYVNMGTHHAREWPSGELPMEFAIDLVERYDAGNGRVTSLLDNVRVFIFPVVNADGFIASRSFGPDAGDNGPLPTGQTGAYKRKNCRPLNAADELLPCAARSESGVDLNRNYGAYWGGAGASTSATNQTYRGTAPFSEPESEAVHQFTSGIHPTVLIANHTFTDEGVWLRQPGFREVLMTTPDEAAMKDLGDAMASATGWASRLSWTLGDITGATEDWNYFAQGTYGYTPEVRGSNFHTNYADAVVEEYLGDAQHAGEGVREAFLIAGERAANAADHGIVKGTAPGAAMLRLRKEFQTPTCVGGCNSPTEFVDDVLDTELEVPADGTYNWHVNPSGRPLHQSENWTMSCELPAQDPVSVEVAVDRGEMVTVDWEEDCTTSFGGSPPLPSCDGEEATIIGTPGDDRGASKLVGTDGEDVIVGLRGKDVIRGAGEDDIICGGGGADKLRGKGGLDTLFGENGRDHLVGGSNFDELFGGPKRDSCRDDGQDFLKGCRRNG